MMIMFYDQAFEKIESFLSARTGAVTAKDIQYATGYQRDVVRRYLFTARNRGAVQMITGGDITRYKLNKNDGGFGYDQRHEARKAKI